MKKNIFLTQFSMAEFYAQQKPLVPFYGGSSNINKKSADEKIDQRMKEVG